VPHGQEHCIRKCVPAEQAAPNSKDVLRQAGRTHVWSKGEVTLPVHCSNASSPWVMLCTCSTSSEGRWRFTLEVSAFLYSTYPILLVHPYPWPMRTVAETGLTQTALAGLPQYKGAFVGEEDQHPVVGPRPAVPRPRGVCPCWQTRRTFLAGEREDNPRLLTAFCIV